MELLKARRCFRAVWAFEREAPEDSGAHCQCGVVLRRGLREAWANDVLPPADAALLERAGDCGNAAFAADLVVSQVGGMLGLSKDVSEFRCLPTLQSPEFPFVQGGDFECIERRRADEGYPDANAEGEAVDPLERAGRETAMAGVGRGDKIGDLVLLRAVWT